MASWPFRPAFISASVMTAASSSSGSQKNRATTEKTKSASTKPRSTSAGRRAQKRVRVSDLTRKYRNKVPEFDEGLLIGDATANLVMDGEFGQIVSDSKLHSKSSHGLSQSEIPRSSSSASEDSSGSTSSRSSASISTTPSIDSAFIIRKRGAARVRATVSHSRFPRTWGDALEHAGEALVKAFKDGHDRVRVDLCYPHLLQDAPTVNVLSYDSDGRIRKTGYLAHIVASLLNTTLLASRTGHSMKKNFSPRAIVVLFNTQREADLGASIVKECEKDVGLPVRVGVLGQVDMGEFLTNLVVMVAPSNRRGNPTQIEAVEQVHYSNFNVQNWVVMLDPDLVALTNFPSLSNEPRQPVLLSDYLTTYHMDPVAYPSKVATGAVLRCFPRKWELYLQRADDANGFRLVSEQPARPSLEKIHCEFSWRIESGCL